jgi:curved DNA-binding protein CbpA
VTDERDPYEVLQVASGADDAVLRAAYRALAHRYHPDIAGPDGEERMRELNAAWEMIGTPGRRAAYHRERGESGAGRAAAAPAGTSGSGSRPAQPATGTRPTPPSSAPPWTGAAGAPPGNPSGSVLDFGVFYGWSLGEIARYDAGYLQWLDKKPEGRQYAAEIDVLLKRYGLREAPAQAATSLNRRGGRIFGR